MIYDQERDEDGFTFLTDKKVEEVKNPEENMPRRRGGYVEENTKVAEVRKVEKVAPRKVEKVEKTDEEKDTEKFNLIIIIAAIIAVIIAVIVVVNVLKSGDDSNSLPQSGNGSSQTTNTSSNSGSSKPSGNTSGTSGNSGNSSNTYDAYPITITSETYIKGGNFFNNTEKIEGDKAYVEYKQISGLKDKSKEEKINQMLKETSVNLYDKQYLQDENTLFIDVTTKLSVNFGTLSYVAIKQYEDIDGNRVNEKAVSVNIKLDTLEKITFEDLFNSAANIKSMYPDYVKGKVEAFYFTPEKIYAYGKGIEAKEIDIAKNIASIEIYNKFSASASLFEKSATSQNKYSVLKTTVSTETKDRGFKKK